MAKDRLFGVAHILLHDPAWAVEEIARVRPEGSGWPWSLRPPWTASHCPMATSTRCGPPSASTASPRSSTSRSSRARCTRPGAQGEPEDGERLFDSIFLYLAPAVALADLILNGVLERFPGLRVGVVELTASWVPHFLLHIDGASDFYALRHGEPYRSSPRAPRSTSCARSGWRPCRTRCRTASCPGSGTTPT